MDQQSWMDSTMERSAKLGLEVLKRASRRRVDWTSISLSQSQSPFEELNPSSVKKNQTKPSSLNTDRRGVGSPQAHASSEEVTPSSAKMNQTKPSTSQIDWTSSLALAAAQDITPRSFKKSNRELRDAFATIKDFMKKTSQHCKRYYDSSCCADHTESETTHISRFHSQPRAPWSPPPGLELDLPVYEQDGDEGLRSSQVSPREEDFQIVVSPGSYAVTASLAESRQQTHEVNISAGESVKLTFEL